MVLKLKDSIIFSNTYNKEQPQTHINKYNTTIKYTNFSRHNQLNKKYYKLVSNTNPLKNYLSMSTKTFFNFESVKKPELELNYAYNKLYFFQKFVKYSNNNPTKLLLNKLMINFTTKNVAGLPQTNNAKSYTISYLSNSSINLKPLKNQNKLMYVKGYSKFDNIFTDFSSNYVTYSNLNKLFKNPFNYHRRLSIYCSPPHPKINRRVAITNLSYSVGLKLEEYCTLPITPPKHPNYNFKFSTYLGEKVTIKPQTTLSRYSTYPINMLKYGVDLASSWALNYSTESPNILSILYIRSQYQKFFLPSLLYNPSPTSIDQIRFYSRSGLNFIISNIGLFFFINQSKMTYVNSIKFNYIYKFKKIMYTFAKPNVIKNTLLRRNSSIILFNLIFKSKNYNKLTIYHNFLNKNPSLVKSAYKLNPSNYNNLLNKDYNSVTTNNLSNPNDIRLPRVRFKPGYQRLWRESRLSLKELLGLKFIYQKQLTKYLIRFYAKASISFFVKNELSLDKVVIYSRILPDLYTYNLFLNSKQIFLNGSTPSQGNTTCVVNDFIQLVVSKWYYVFFRWILNWVVSRFRKTKRLIYRKGLSSRYKVLKARKQRSFNVPNWIFYSKYDFSDVKPFIEVDYFSLSFFIIYEPYINYYYSQLDFILPNVNIYRLYNWKYIT